jgi:hypothetical protein
MLHFPRLADPLPRAPEGIANWKRASTRVVARRGLGSSAWSGDVRQYESMQPSSSSPPLRVIHLIGRARRGTSGTVFSIGGQGSDLGELVNIDRLPLSSAAIVVVQEEPAERLRRLDIDREQTADAREWAYQVFRAGAQTVIFLPAMPLDIAEQSVAAMAGKLATSNAPDLWDLIEAVRSARRAITRFRPDRLGGRAAALVSGLNKVARREAKCELAMDITLFTRVDNFEMPDGFTQFSKGALPS